MAKKISSTTVRVRYQTKNGVRIVVQSWARDIRNNRGRTVALDYEDILTNVSLDAIVNDEDAWRNPPLLECIRGWEDKIDSIRNSAITGFRDRKSTRLNSSHIPLSRMPSSA